MEKSHFGAHISAEVERSLIYQPKFLVKSIWDIEHWRNNELISLEEGTKNICVDEGLNLLMDVMFGATAKSATWYVLIFETDTTPAAGTTYDVPVWTEANASYDEATRPEYIDVPSASKVMTNTASKATFTMNATKTIYGAALVNENTKGAHGAGPRIYCAAKFASSKACESADVLKVTVAITAADA